MSKTATIKNRLKMGLAHRGLMLFVLRHPSSVVDLFELRSSAIRSYALRLTMRDAVHRFENLYSSWNFVDLERATNIIEKETQGGWFRIPCWQSFLYVLCRLMKPDIVVETGVAMGYSSAHILQALSDNERGFLHSVDLPDVSYVLDDGKLHRDPLPSHAGSGFGVPKELRKRWTLHIGRSSEVLPVLLSQLGRIDIFVHDSEHTYTNMMFEFTTAWPHIRSGGFLISDDVTSNDAFVQFSTQCRVDYAIVRRLGLVMK